MKNKTTGITAEERRLRSERLMSRLMGICEGFDAAATPDVQQMQKELSDVEQQLAAERAKVAELEKKLDALKPFDICEWRECVRREVALECAEIAERESEDDKRERDTHEKGSMEWARWNWRSVEAEYIAEYIRDKFGVTQ